MMAAGFYDPLRMIIGWWSTQHIPRGPFVVVASQVYDPGSRDGQDYQAVGQSETVYEEVSQLEQAEGQT